MTCMTVNRNTFKVIREKVSCSIAVIYNTVTNLGQTFFTLSIGKNKIKIETLFSTYLSGNTVFSEN